MSWCGLHHSDSRAEGSIGRELEYFSDWRQVSNSDGIAHTVRYTTRKIVSPVLEQPSEEGSSLERPKIEWTEPRTIIPRIDQS